jgi:hypothetical protein
VNSAGQVMRKVCPSFTGAGETLHFWACNGVTQNNPAERKRTAIKLVRFGMEQIFIDRTILSAVAACGKHIARR